MDSQELVDLITGSQIIHKALADKKGILKEEQPTIDFAYACVVSIKDVKKGEILSERNIWVKRPGTGEIMAAGFKKVLGRRAGKDIPANTQIKWKDLLR
jgi:N-acetylneuraminate synthase